MKLLSNQVNKDFEASANEVIKLSISLAVSCGVFLFAWFVISMLFTMKKKFAKKTLNKRRPSIDPLDTLKTIFIHELHELFILVLCLLFNK